MSPFARQNGVLHAESVSLIDIASHFGTPCWVYSRHALETAFDEFQQELIGLDSLVAGRTVRTAQGSRSAVRISNSTASTNDSCDSAA